MIAGGIDFTDSRYVGGSTTLCGTKARSGPVSDVARQYDCDVYN